MSNPFRLALREEGRWWVAYLAKQQTMDDAIEIARIAMGPVVHNIEIKDAFMQLMKDVVTEAFKQKSIGLLGWQEPQAAPESEKAGHA